MANNSVYTVTPPDLHLSESGPNIFLLGMSRETSQPIVDLLSRIYPDVELTIFVSDEEFSPEHIAWYRSVVGIAQLYVIVNIDNITCEELFLAMQADHFHDMQVFWFTNEKRRSNVAVLLNSYHVRVFESVDSLEEFLTDE